MPDLHEDFMRSYIAAEPKLRAFALACGLPLEQVDDLAQQAALVLWRRFGEYDRARPFLPWALGVTRNLIHETRREGAQSRRLLAPAVAERLAEACAGLEEKIDLRRHALRGCLEKLPAHHRDLLDLRYGLGLPLVEIGSRLKRGLSAVNMALHRVRQLLLECVHREASS
jgi:RNA polymerase sigma-70 factor (ECF subfamily)